MGPSQDQRVSNCCHGNHINKDSDLNKNEITVYLVSLLSFLSSQRIMQEMQFGHSEYDRVNVNEIT